MALAGAVFTIARSAEALTRVAVAAEVLLPVVGSEVALVTVAVLLSVVPSATLLPTCTTNVKLAEAPLASVAIVQLTVLVPLQLNADPVFCVIDTKLVFAGSVSVQLTLCASLGPLFATATV